MVEYLRRIGYRVSSNIVPNYLLTFPSDAASCGYDTITIARRSQRPKRRAYNGDEGQRFDERFR